MSWICPKCETENPDNLNICEVCDSPREYSTDDLIKVRLKEKYNPIYNTFIRYHYSFLDLADKGDANAQYAVAEWFFKRAKDNFASEYDIIAVFWYQKAAEKGHAEALFKLGLCYEEGRGVPQQKEWAMKWYKKAAEMGNEAALPKYTKLKYSNKTYKQVIKYELSLLTDAEKGDMKSQFNLGEWFFSHSSQNSYKAEAIAWYTKAALNDHVGAMLKLGYCYEKGIGTLIDIDAAMKWYEKASQMGNDSACIHLTKLYLHGGFMIPKNVKKAIILYEKAGKGLNKIDLYIIGHSYEMGDGVSTNMEKAAIYYKESAAKDYHLAQYRLAKCYENGSGVIQDIDCAKYWYERASKLGNTSAQQNLERLINNEQSSQQHLQESSRQIDTFIIFIFGSIGGGVGFYCVEDALPSLNANLYNIWSQTYPVNLILCIIIGIITVFISERKE